MPTWLRILFNIELSPWPAIMGCGQAAGEGENVPGVLCMQAAANATDGKGRDLGE